MKSIYMIDARTFTGLRRVCAALAHNPDRAEVLAPLLAALLERATRAELEMDNEGGKQACLN